MAVKQTMEQIITDYKEDDICMGEFLASVPADGYSLEEAFELYISIMKRIEGDQFFKIAEGETIEL